MSTREPIEGQHLSDGDLLQYSDGAVSLAERRAVSAHLTACARCAAELEMLSGHIRRFGELVSDLDAVQVSPERRARSLAAIRAAATHGAGRAIRSRSVAAWFTLPRLAAAVVLLAAGVVGARPVLAWVVTQVEQLFGSGEAVRRSPRVVSTPPVPLPHTTFSFAPSKAAFDLYIPRLVDGDSLEVRIDSAAVVSISARAQRGELLPVFELQGSGVRIRSVSALPERYVVLLPLTVKDVIVHAGDQPAKRLTAPQPGITYVFDLRSFHLPQ
jgi:hypothetical protein